MAHLTGFGLENFRVFKKETWFDLAPITILVGPNSSGKSSVNKAILLLKENLFSQKINKDAFNIEFLKFSTDKSVLGDFNTCKSNENPNNDEIIFLLPFHFRYVQEELVLRLSYKAIQHEIDKAQLNCFQIMDEIRNEKIFDFNKTKNGWQGKIKFSYLYRNIQKSMINSNKLRRENMDLDTVLTNYLENNENRDYFIEEKFLDENEITGAFGQKIIPFCKNNKLFWRSPTYFEPMPRPNVSNKYFNFNEPIFNYFFLMNDSEIDYWDHTLSEQFKRSLKTKINEFMKKNYVEIEEFRLKKMSKIVKEELQLLDNHLLQSGMFLSLKSLLLSIINELFANIKEDSNNLLLKYFLEFKEEISGFNCLNDENKKITNSRIFFDHIIVEGLIESVKFAFKTFEDTDYLGSVKTEVQRLYLQNSTHIEFVRQLNEFKSHYEFQKKEMLEFVNSWLVRFGISEKLDIRFNNKYKGFEVYLGDQLAADEGYGVNQLIPLLLKIILKEDQANNDSSTIDDGGETIFRMPHIPSVIIIEEPETNLHPDFQSKLADLLVDAAKRYNIQFIIETHSEYLIRKLQYLTARKEITPKDSIIYYFHNPDKVPKGEKQVKKITILEDGSLSDNFGPGFFDEAINLKLDLLKLKNQKN